METLKRSSAVHLLTYWLIIFFIVAAFAHQAVLVLRLFLWSWAGGSLHHGAGPSVRPGCTCRVPPAGSRSSRGLPRCLFKGYQLLQRNTTCAVKTHSGHIQYRSGHRHASWEESWYFVQLCHELCKLKNNNNNDINKCQNQGRSICWDQSSATAAIKLQN